MRRNGISADVFSHDRATFRERIARLAGGTTYREPMEGHSTDPHRLTDLDVAAALAFARQGASDIGPDVAYCIICQTDAHRPRIVRELALALTASGGYYLRAARPYLLHIADQAFAAAVWQARVAKPEGLGDKAYSALMLAGVATLHRAADEAIHRAEQVFRARAA